MAHTHIYENGQVIGTLWLDPQSSHVLDDGSVASQNAVEGLRHGLKREHGQQLLDAIVAALDSSTMLKAEHCHDDHDNHNDHHHHGRHGRAVKRPLYHWLEAKNLEQWMDPSHTGPGETYLTETGSDPQSEWNDDVPLFDNPVRLTIDSDQLDPELFDKTYSGWLGNHLYQGPIPQEAVADVQSFKRPESWDTMNVTPSQSDHWEDYGDDERRHNDVSFSNDTRMLAKTQTI